jgi:hypothetical protein
MKRYDRMSTLFFLALAIAVILESIRVGPGSLSVPGPGLIPLGCGLGLGVLSLIVFAVSFQDVSEGAPLKKAAGLGWGTASTLLSMVAYGFLLDPLGFRLVTFLWLAFVCRWIGRLGWKATIVTSVTSTFFTWLLFEYFLEIRFPHGVMGV